MSLQILDNLASLNRLPRRMLVHDPATASGAWRTSIKRARELDVERVAFNTGTFINCLTIDLDGEAAEEHRWEDLGLPPTISVQNLAGSRSRRPGRHDSYFLETPVFSGAAATKPLKYARLVRRALTAALGGDPHYSNLLTKSPWHSRHKLTTPHNWTGGAQGFLYTLDYIASAIDLDYWADRFKHDDARRGVMPRLDDSARNVSLFDAARHFAYSMPQFNSAALTAFIDEQNMLFIEPLKISETRSIARSIEKWMKHTYAARGERNIEKQAERGKISGGIRRADARGPEYLARHQAGESWQQIADSVGKTREAVKQAARRAAGWAS
ncbi:MAG TPA: replication initiation protein [Ferrovibrio sp.]|uniref:replication initiation protein n=1 Tax=Ferrovibrio sp. TaxID=1917215 RepID=UPI002ED31A5B